MGQPATRCHAYTVWAWRANMRRCSNRWTDEQNSLTPADLKRIADNENYSNVAKPLCAES